MAESVDRSHFQYLSEQNPDDVCSRSLCEYNPAEKAFSISVWSQEYRIFPHRQKIVCSSKGIQKAHDYFYLFIVYYLLKSKEIDIANEWISEKDIPGGTTFFRGPHEIPTKIVTDRLNNNIDAFHKVCEQLNGIPLSMADAAYRFEITPRIPVAVLFWRGDDDFPPELKLLYDRTITEHLASDIIFALAVGVCVRFAKTIDSMKSLAEK